MDLNPSQRPFRPRAYPSMESDDSSRVDSESTGNGESAIERCSDWQASESCEIPMTQTTHLNEQQTTAQVASNERPFQCSQCNRTYKHKGNLTRHRHFMHSELFQCHKCSLGYSKESTLIRHYKRCHSTHGPNFKCSVCGMTYKSKLSLLRHCTMNHNGQGYGDVPKTCSECGKVYCTEVGLLRHSRSCYNDRGGLVKMFQCSECGKCYSWKVSLLRHCKKHNGRGCDTKEKVQCSECGLHFAWIGSLAKHCKKKHDGLGYALRSTDHNTQENTSGKQNGRYPCSCCDLIFHSLNSYKTHLFSHSSSTTVVLCTVCGREYDSVAKLWQHQTRTHRDYRPRQLRHKFTGSIRRRSRQIPHQFRKKTHTSKKCPHCSNRFRSASALFRHSCSKKSPKDMSTGEAEMIPTSQEVDTILTPAMSLDPVLVPSTGDAEMIPTSQEVDTLTPAMSLDPVVVPLNTASGHGYKCALCGKVLTRLENFRNHINLHTGTRPYVCEVCNMAFPYSSAKSHHMMQHRNGNSPQEQTKKQVKQKKGSEPVTDEVQSSPNCHEKTKKPVKKSSRLTTHSNSRQNAITLVSSEEVSEIQMASSRNRHQMTKKHSINHAMSSKEGTAANGEASEIPQHNHESLQGAIYSAALDHHCFSCETCGISLQRYCAYMGQHAQSSNTNSSTQLQCQGWCAPATGVLRSPPPSSHNRVDREQRRRFACQQCDKSYTHASSLRRHISTEHPKLLLPTCMQLHSDEQIEQQEVPGANLILHPSAQGYPQEVCEAALASAVLFMHVYIYITEKWMTSMKCTKCLPTANRSISFFLPQPLTSRQ